MENVAVVGFSVNPEIVLEYDRMDPVEKGELDSIKPYLCGTSANFATGVTSLGQSCKVLALTGVDDDFESLILRFSLKKYEVSFTEFRILNRSHISILPVDGISPSKIFGKKGDIEISKIKETILKINQEEGLWRIATGVRPEEIDLVKALFNKHAGYRSLNPRPKLIADRNNFQEILHSTDLLIMNHTEFDSCKTTSIGELHEHGPKLIIVTQNKNGGLFSRMGEKPERFDSCSDYIKRSSLIYEPGAGDWFHAAFITRCMELGKSIDTLSFNEIRDCISFATRVSGKKVTMKGAANGPTKEDL